VLICDAKPVFLNTVIYYLQGRSQAWAWGGSSPPKRKISPPKQSLAHDAHGLESLDGENRELCGQATNLQACINVVAGFTTQLEK